MTGCVLPELMVLRLERVGRRVGLVVVQVAEAGAALAVALTPLLLLLILLRLVAGGRLLLRVQVVVKVVVRVKVAATRGLKVGWQYKISIFHIDEQIWIWISEQMVVAPV